MFSTRGRFGVGSMGHGMVEFTGGNAAEVLAACQAGSEQVAHALGEAFGGEYVVAAGEPSPLSAEALPGEAAGLHVAVDVGASQISILVPNTESFLPDWCATPDDAQRDRLNALADALGRLVLPEPFTANAANASWNDDLAQVFAKARDDAKPTMLPLSIVRGEQQVDALLLWPLAPLNAPQSENVESPPPATAPQTTASPATARPAPRRKLAPYTTIDEGIEQLPQYARSLLRIKVPVTVTLATTKQPISRILELGPGSIIQFNKSCEDNLDLEIGDQRIAEGEAVKVGDKFGLWITGMTLPAERFWSMKSAGRRVK